MTDELERRVVERTRELTAANQRLRHQLLELRQVEAEFLLLQAAVRETNESIIITTARLDLPGPEIVFVNPAFTTMTGYAAEEAIGQTPRLLQGPRTDRIVLERLRRQLTAGRVFFGEITNYRKDGSPFAVEGHVAPIRNERGETTHYVSAQRDVTEQRRAERDLARLLAREQAARREAEVLARLAASVTASLNPSETITAAVAALPDLLGADICGIALPGADGQLGWEGFVGPDLARHARWSPGQGYVGRAFSEGRLLRSDDREQEGDSGPETALGPVARSVLAIPLVAHGRTLGVITVAALAPAAFSDRHGALLLAVAQQVAAALAAARSRQEYQDEAAQKTAVLEQMNDAVLVTDADGAIVLANSAAGSLFSTEPTRLLGLRPGDQPWRVFDSTGRELTVAERPLSRAILGEPVAGEYLIRDGAGVECWVWGSAAPLRDSWGLVQGAVNVFRDITELRRQQQAAAQGEKLRALGEMASGVAHDLNQYLSLIAGHGELASAALARQTPDLDALQESLETISRAAMDGAETVRRLLAFGRPRQEGAARPIDLRELLTEVAELTAPSWRDAAQADGRPIRLLVECEGEVTIEGWPASLREALTNLIFNAVDALPRGGSIRLRATRRDDRVAVDLRDTGVGMSPELQARIFEPYFTTKGERGTGLGLAMVFGIVERHGGTVAVDSVPGAGTTFHLNFSAAAADDAGAPPTEQVRVQPKRVLVVDDQPQIGRMVASMLAADGHIVAITTSAEAALERLASEPFDIMISDIGLGTGMNGWELAERVVAEHPAVRLVLATGWGAQIDPLEAARRGIRAVLAKPYRWADLRQIVARL